MTSTDWDPSFIDGLASCNQLVLLNNRGIGGSTDNGQSFDIATLADDVALVIDHASRPIARSRCFFQMTSPNLFIKCSAAS